jgi:hypothetical protein
MLAGYLPQRVREDDATNPVRGVGAVGAVITYLLWEWYRVSCSWDLFGLR